MDDDDAHPTAWRKRKMIMDSMVVENVMPILARMNSYACTCQPCSWFVNLVYSARAYHHGVEENLSSSNHIRQRSKDGWYCSLADPNITIISTAAATSVCGLYSIAYMKAVTLSDTAWESAPVTLATSLRIGR